MTLDWTDYDRRLAPYLDGSAFTSAHGYWGPGYGLPIDHMMLPFNNEQGGDDSTVWPMALPNGRRTPEYEAVWMEAGRQVRVHLDQNPRGDVYMARCVHYQKRDSLGFKRLRAR